MHIGDIFFLKIKSTHTGIQKELFQTKKKRKTNVEKQTKKTRRGNF